MSVKWLLPLALALSVQAAAQDLQQVARGLDVRVEELEGQVGINGLPFAISRAVGPGVPNLAERVVQQWSRQSGFESVRRLQCCGWTFASRIHNGESQVVQWRLSGTDAQLLSSTLRISARTPAPPVVSAPLLPDCSWSRPVHGRIAGSQFIQQSARCALAPEEALQLMVRRLENAGWHSRRQGPLLVQAQRGTTKAQLIAAPEQDPLPVLAPALSSLVLLESRPVGRSHR
jgi:hypothetical protein